MNSAHGHAAVPTADPTAPRLRRHLRSRSSARRSTPWRLGVAVLLGATFATATVAGVAGASNRHRQSVTTITIWNDPLAAGSVGVPASKSFLTKGVELFEKQNPDIKVNIVQEAFAASTSFETLLRSSEVAGTTPDIGQLYVGGQVIQNAPYLVALNSYLPKSFVSSLYDGWQFVTGGYKAGGPIYAVPYGSGYWYVVYYNKKDFAKAGIKGPFPTTWAGLVALAEKLKAHGITPFEFGEKEGYFGAWTEDALISGLVGDQGVLNFFSGKSSLDSATLEDAYAAWHELYGDGLTNSDAPSLTYTSGVAEYAAGKAAMTITGEYYDSQITAGLGDNVGLFPVPTLPGSKYPHVLSGGPNNSYVIFKTSKHIADDVKLLEFLASPEVQELGVNELGQLPNNSSFKVTPAFAKAQPLLADVYKYIEVDHYTLAEAFDNIMPGSICSYWYQTNNAVFG
ncbi:MAG TPA: ABC transporter substrate-binding protein, partial [Acidimicrobiales bacterium]|nr:ABC transporter substrate-binding protein [Acidimicrobiales bacterium]